MTDQLQAELSGPTSARLATPVAGLVVGVLLAVAIIAGFSIYTTREIRRLRDEQATLSERNRLDGLQIVRIQQNLSTVAATLRDMLDRTEPYPFVAWANTFARLRLDLDQALDRERALAPVGRPAGESARIEETARRFWAAMDLAFEEARRGDETRAAAVVRDQATVRHAELVSLVSQLLIHNTRVDEEAATRARAIYDRVARDIYLLSAVLIAVTLIGGLLLVSATRRTFAALETVAAERRALSWRMLKMQEDLQTSFARELHDEFGQILTAMGTMLGRIRRRAEGHDGAAPASTSEGAAWLADLAEVQQIAQQTLDRIRTRSRLLHPVILDDFGLQQAIAWYADEFARQHGIAAGFEPSGDLAGLPPEVATHLYRIVQESLTNVARHAAASRVSVRLARRPGGVSLTVEDDGRGIDVAPGTSGPVPAGGIGITSMRERAALMHGTLAIGRSPLGGLSIGVSVPLGNPPSVALSPEP
jgi:signal transduction histidine kinase